MKYTGQHVNPNKAPLGQQGSVERIKTNSPIGEFVDANGLNHGPTTNFTIKYGKDGVHIVPAQSMGSDSIEFKHLI